MSGGSLDDPALAVDDRRELREAPRMLSFDCAFATLRSNSCRCLRLALLRQERGDLLDVDAGVPELEVRHPGEVS